MSQAATTQAVVSTVRLDSIRGAIVSLRTYQWSKNLLLFAGVVFSGNLTSAAALNSSVGAFMLFCLASSAIYLFNDIRDFESDRHHPRKRHRPIAAGMLSRKTAAGLALGLAMPALAFAARLGTRFFCSLLAYVLLNLCYSLGLKNVVILDVFSIGLGFVLRAVAGAYAVGVAPSDWLILCTLSAALLIGFGKRRHEAGLLQQDAAQHRATLQEYTLPFANAMVTMLAGVVIVTYCIYAVSQHPGSVPGSAGMVFTTPMVFYGVLRYLYLAMKADQGGDPAQLLVSDLPSLLNCVAWAVTVCAAIYAGR